MRYRFTSDSPLGAHWSVKDAETGEYLTNIVSATIRVEATGYAFATVVELKRDDVGKLVPGETVTREVEAELDVEAIDPRPFINGPVTIGRAMIDIMTPGELGALRAAIERASREIGVQPTQAVAT